MQKEIQIDGCIEIPPEMSLDAFMELFLELIESKGWLFGGGFHEIIDGYYINPDGTKGESVISDETAAS